MTVVTPCFAGPLGDVFQIAVRETTEGGEADSLVEYIVETSERLAPKECLGAFMILCGGLVMAMGEKIEGVYEDLANEVVRAEALGMCAFGEQGPNCNRESMHGNLMFGVLMFSNKPVRPTR